MTKGAQMQFTTFAYMSHEGLYVFLHSNSDATGDCLGTYHVLVHYFHGPYCFRNWF